MTEKKPHNKPQTLSHEVHLGSMKAFAIRLQNGEEVKSTLLRVVKENGIKNAFILSCVGSVYSIRLRMASTKKYDSKDTCCNGNNNNNSNNNNNNNKTDDSVVVDSSDSDLNNLKEQYNERIRLYDDYYEVISFSGTISGLTDICHLHCSISDNAGHVIGTLVLYVTYVMYVCMHVCIYV